MNIEKLIQEIRKFPVLYDHWNDKYRNAEHKERVWKIIASTMEVEGGVEECKRKWASIRDQQRRTLQKRKSKSGQSAAKVRKYKYEDMLTFLLPHLGDKDCPPSVPQAGYKEEEDFEFDADPLEIPTPEICQEDTPGNQLMAYILAEKEKSPTSKQDPVDAFLCGIAPTLKSLDPVLLNEAKGKIFGVVQEVELRQLRLNAGSQDPYFMPNYLKHSPSSAQSASSSPSHLTTDETTINK